MFDFDEDLLAKAVTSLSSFIVFFKVSNYNPDKSQKNTALICMGVLGAAHTHVTVALNLHKYPVVHTY